MEEDRLNRKYWDLVSGIFLLALAALLYAGSTRVQSIAVTTFGAGFFPAIVAGLLAVVSVPIIIAGLRKARGGAAADKAPEEKPRTWGVLATFGIMILYAALLPKVGFIIMTVLYLFAQMLILAPKSKHNYALVGVISVVSSVVIYYTFVKVFQLMLPAGILG